MRHFAERCFVIFALICGSVTLVHAQNHQEKTHIELVVTPRRVTAQEPAPIAPLSPSRFRLSQLGQNLSFTSHSDYPRHLLIVTEAPLRCDDLPGALIEKMLSDHWRVRITDTEGTATDELIGKIGVASGCSAVTHLAPSVVINELVQHAGRRVVLFTGTAPAGLLQAARTIPEIYIVDGGVQVTSESPLLQVPQPTPVSPSETTAVSGYPVRCREVGGKVAPNDPCNINTSTTYLKSGFRDGVNHEKSVTGALKTIELASSRYYDLTFEPADTAQVQLAIHHSGWINLTATMYSTTEPTPNLPPARLVKTKDLRVTER